MIASLMPMLGKLKTGLPRTVRTVSETGPAWVKISSKPQMRAVYGYQNEKEMFLERFVCLIIYINSHYPSIPEE